MIRMRSVVLLLCIVALAWCCRLAADPPTKVDPRKETLNQRIARLSGVKEKDAERVVNALGAAAFEDLKQGKTVSIPNLGSFRIVRYPSYRNIDNTTRPYTVPAVNAVEFTQATSLGEAANIEGIEPEEKIPPPYQFNPLGGRTPTQTPPEVRTSGQRVPYTR